VVDLIKHCRGRLDSPSVSILMRYLYFKKDIYDAFLYKIVDRLYLDKTQPITHFECALLCALMFRRNKFLVKNKHFQTAKPIFSSSRFLNVSTLGEMKVCYLQF
jgi:hypothetical protein